MQTTTHEVGRKHADARELHAGLEGVVVAETLLSDVDGAAGRLVIAGWNVERLALEARFEEACALLWYGREPGSGAEDVARDLAEGRRLAFEGLPRLGDALRLGDGMDALRAAIAHWPGDSRPAHVVGAIATVASAWARARRGLPAIAPSARRDHAADFLAMLGGPADEARARALGSYLVTVIDHGLNASTFAARVVTSTGSDLVSSVVAAIGALKGPLHGGAPGPVLDLLDSVSTPDRAATHLAAELTAGRRIMGMGHRIYRVRDPRAEVLERAIERLERDLTADHDGSAVRGRLALARAVERDAETLLAARHPDRPLRANVEFYTAVLLEAVGVPREIFSLVFAASRAAGWCAHVSEQARTGRLIRPASRYVGTAPAP